MKKFFRIGSGKKKSSDASASGRGSNRSLDKEQGSFGYELREKDLGKLHKAAWNGDINKVKQLAKKDANSLDKEKRLENSFALYDKFEICIVRLRAHLHACIQTNTNRVISGYCTSF